MKQTLIVIISTVIIICAFIISNYYTIQDKKIQINKFNIKYEKYNNLEITGREIATVINQAVNDNEQAYITKDEKGKYIQNDENSINIEVKITEIENGKIYNMETLYNGGMNEFVKYYGDITFKCEKLEYNTKGQVKYILFTQININ